MEREDTTPWNRQFWPWFIMALPASAVVAGLYTVWLAMQTGDSLVVHSSDGMNIVTERNLDAEREALRLGLSAVIDIQVETGAVAVAIRSELETELPAALQLRLRHQEMLTYRFFRQCQMLQVPKSGSGISAQRRRAVIN